jgi:hypothetical protein
MEHFFAAFLVVAIMLEMYEINFARKLVSKGNVRIQTLTAIGSSGLLYALFVFMGWLASDLTPQFSALMKDVLAAGAILILVAYSFIRNKRYRKADNVVYGNFSLFILLTVGRSILHLITGFVIGLLGVSIEWFYQGFLLGMVLFGAAVMLGKKPAEKIFGIRVGYIKIISYIIAAVLVFF